MSCWQACFSGFRSYKRGKQATLAHCADAKTGTILVGGENLIDFIQTQSSSDKGALPTYRANPGGSPYNIAKALGRQVQGNFSVGYLTPISNDSLGELLASGLSTTNTNVKLLAPRRSDPTSLAVVSLKDGVPSYQFYRERTAERMVSRSGLESSAPSDAIALVLGSLALTGGADADVWADFYCKRYGAGLFTMLDPNIRAAFIHDRKAYMSRLNRVLKHTDLIKLSDEDLEWIAGGSDLIREASDILERSSAPIIVVTKGADGAFALGRKGGASARLEVHLKAAPVNGLRDTVGAGDTFGATLLASLAQTGRLCVEALSAMSASEVEAWMWRASCAAAMNCEREGCNPPRVEEIDAAVKKRQ